MSSYQTNFIVYLVLVATFVVLHLAQAQSDVYQKRETKQRLCGRQLANALRLRCDGVYNEMFKKNGQELEMDDYPYAYDYPLRSRSNANAMMGRFGGATFRRQTRGVHDECCAKTCTMDELASYCGR